jgi:hypothetical protein
VSTFLELFRARFTAVWFVLVAATLLSVSFGNEHLLDSSEGSAIAVLVVAFVKVRLVGLHFMELRDSPLVLRSIFEAYVLAVCALLIGFYLLA